MSKKRKTFKFNPHEHPELFQDTGITPEILSRKDLTAPDKLVWGQLQLYRKNGSPDQSHDPAHQCLAFELGTDITTIQKAIKHLRKKGLI